MRERRVVAALIVALALAYPVCAQRKTDRERDGLVGPVKSFYVEMAGLINRDGEWVEGEPRRYGGETYSRSGWGPWGKSPKGGSYKVSHGGHGDFIFDENGNKTVVIHYSEKDAVTGRDFYKYDDSGNELEQALYDADGQLKERTIQIYGGGGRRLERAVYAGDGALKHRWVYTNDQKGNVIEDTLFETGRETERRKYDYEFDAVGNWVKRTCYIEVTKDGQLLWEPELVVRRTITYYQARQTSR